MEILKGVTFTRLANRPSKMFWKRPIKFYNEKCIDIGKQTLTWVKDKVFEVTSIDASSTKFHEK